MRTLSCMLRYKLCWAEAEPKLCIGYARVVASRGPPYIYPKPNRMVNGPFWIELLGQIAVVMWGAKQIYPKMLEEVEHFSEGYFIAI